MIRTATLEDLPALRDLARRANDAPYDLAAVIEEKCFGPGVSGPPVTTVVEADGALRAAAVHCGKYLRLIVVDRDHRRRGLATALLGEPAVAGAEAGNYFTPGVLESDAGTVAFLRARGFREEKVFWNLHAATAPGQAVRPPLRSGIDEAFLAFVRREFGPIWAFEVSRAQAAVWIEDVGFAAVEANNRGLGTFGPAGVRQGERGKGHGRRLLLAALAELRRLGYERAIIPWTDAVDFYRRSCGAEPAHRFVTLARR